MTARLAFPLKEQAGLDRLPSVVSWKAIGLSYVTLARPVCGFGMPSGTL